MSTGFHQFGRTHLLNAWRNVFGREPALHEVQIVQAVSVGEGGYGLAAYKNEQTGETRVLNNWGAVQCKGGPPCGGACFEVTDTHADGSKYQWCYRSFATPEEGAADYLKVLANIVDREVGFQTALDSMSTDAFVESMKKGGYFEAKLALYQKRVWENLNTMAKALGEPVSVTKEGSVVDASPLLSSLSSLPADMQASALRNHLSIADRANQDCWRREAYRILNQNGHADDDISFYPEDD